MAVPFFITMGVFMGSGGISNKLIARISGGNSVVTILLINLILLLLGMIMDMSPIILIATPILLPVAVGAGLHPIQFGIMMVLNCGIGLLTPPVGSVLFIGSAVAHRPMDKVVKGTMPFYLCMIAAQILISFIPAVSMWLPQVSGALK